MKKWISCLLLLAFFAPVSAEEKLDFDEVSRIAIQSGGRKKPIDTFASESLQIVTGRRAVADPETGRRLDATEAILSIWFGKREWREAPIILVSEPSVREALELPRQRQFSFQELMANRKVAEFHGTITNKRMKEEDLTELEREVEIVLSRMNLFNLIQTGQVMAIVPNPESLSERWATPIDAVSLYDVETASAVLAKMRALSDAFLAGDADRFAFASAEFRQMLRNLAPDQYPTVAALDREVHYNQVHPFRLAWIFYLAGFFFLLPRRTYKIGMGLFTIGFALNVYGFILRSLIAERAPVTNMYETVVWTALSLAIFAIIFEAIYRTRIYALCAAPMAVLALILADLLPTVLDPTINPLPPVLRDNFWLVTHVVTIMIGYAAFALAFAMGHYILGRYLIKPSSIHEKSEVHFMLDRVLQLGVIFLAAGTILGGVWANYSWGRFWGWDPKETWALIALLLYIFASHGRIAGWWGHFGMAVAACLCFNGILMAWYGVNFVMGAGLHSYGFGGGGAKWVGVVVALDALFVAACILIQRRRGGGMGAAMAGAPSEKKLDGTVNPPAAIKP